MEEKLELRLYGLVPYNLSPIQQGIQYGHGAIEYGLKYFNDVEYQDWANNWKTFIILNGGFSNHSVNRYSKDVSLGTMENHLQTLISNGIKVECFYEPDLNDLLSSIIFIVDERVFNREKYPDFIFNSKISSIDNPMFVSEDEEIEFKKWKYNIGGEKNYFLRIFLKNFKLA